MPDQPEPLVVGCGVIGLTSALCLQEASFPVRIVTREEPHDTTSAVAAAVWYPYEVHPKERIVPWSRITRKTLIELASEPDTGVRMTTFVGLFDTPVDDPWWAPAVPSFRHATSDELRLDYVDGYVIEVPLMETPAYLDYLHQRFIAGGGHIEVVPDGIDDVRALCDEHRLIVNCTGLGARTLCGDDALFPIRGQVVRVTNPGLTRCLADDHGPLALTYIIPRGDDCILGGTAEKGVWDEMPSDETTADILQRARTLEPRLHDAKVLDVHVGLRPGRNAARLELERVTERCAIIHNYGHGGAGFTLAWGCAEEVLDLAHTFANSIPQS